MANSTNLPPRSAAVPAAPRNEVPARVDSRLGEIASLLEHSEQSSAIASPTVESCLAQIRLGMASSLFLALRCKHAPTASHSLRVALGCSAWAAALELPREECESIEVAALLHHVGKIGVPDRVLLKPGPLTTDEALLMDRYRQMTVEILTSCCASPLVLSLAAYASAWYDGSRPGGQLAGEQLPLGARLISIVNAFDAMTSSQVYRPALSHERAVKELFTFAGTQFDPGLVRCFSELHERDIERLQNRVAARWLKELNPEASDSAWQLGKLFASRPAPTTENLFQQKLLDNMDDAVVFVDANQQVVLWNRGAERLTGIDGAAVFQQTFIPSLLQLRDEQGNLLNDADCPMARALATGSQSLLRLIFQGRNSSDVTVDAHVIPVIGGDGAVHGVTLLLHDVSPETSLEQRCQRLHEKAIRDPLTQLANRAEFDRVHRLFVETHLQRGLPCSLIICDIDRFKLVNDTYGHPAGDEVIKSFAQLLKSRCRTGDLSARYGGEEFVMLCADCNIGTAFDRAEQIRKALADLPQPVLGGNAANASFGVTELQPGDTAATMLNRADRGLLLAKQSGRNMVVQLGTAAADAKQPEGRRRWWQFWQSGVPDAILKQDLVTTVPLKVALEKLKGFVADHSAVVHSIEASRIQMLVTSDSNQVFRRGTDRPVPLFVELALAEEQVRSSGQSGPTGGASTRTKIQVTIHPKRHRDRRQANAIGGARRLIASLRSYLMANDDHVQNDDDVMRRTEHLLAPRLLKK